MDKKGINSTIIIGEGFVENAFITSWIEDGILFALYKKDAVIGLQAAKELVALRKNISKGASYPCLIYIKNIKAMSKEARTYFAGQEATEGIIKGAFVTDSTFTMVMGNLFLTLDKPLVPSKLFTNKKEAIEWLKK
jgi:hypothetical protein